MSDLAPLAEAVVVDPLVGHPADYHVFHKFLDRCKNLPAITTAVVWPLSDVALEAPVEAAAEGLIEPTLIGDEAAMKALAAKIGVDIIALSHPRRGNRSPRPPSSASACAAPATPRP